MPPLGTENKKIAFPGRPGIIPIIKPPADHPIIGEPGQKLRDAQLCHIGDFRWAIEYPESHIHQYRAFAGITCRTPPRGSAMSPAYLGMTWK
jgi:hypothetical protein